MTAQTIESALEARANGLYVKNNGPQPTSALTIVERLAEHEAEDIFGPEYHSCDVYVVTLANCNGPLASYEFVIDGDNSELWPVLEVELSDAARPPARIRPASGVTTPMLRASVRKPTPCW